MSFKYLLIATVAMFAGFVFAQDDYLGLWIGSFPGQIDEKQYNVLTNDLIDTSPVKSYIHLNQAGYSSEIVFGLNYDYFLSSDLFVEASGAYGGLGGLWFVNLAAGIGYAINVTNTFSIFLEPQASYTSVQGKIGEVGEREGDYYLSAPDGYDYPVGSPVHASGGSFGIALKVGGLLRIGSILVTPSVGYLYGGRIDDWKFTIYDPDDDEINTELPAAGFEESPSSFDPKGLCASISVGIAL